MESIESGFSKIEPQERQKVMPQWHMKMRVRLILLSNGSTVGLDLSQY